MKQSIHVRSINLTGDVRTSREACVVNGRIQLPWQVSFFWVYCGTELADTFAGSTEAG